MTDKRALVEEIIRAAWESGYEMGSQGWTGEMTIEWDGDKPRIELSGVPRFTPNTKEQNIEFRKRWDARVEGSRR